MIKDQYLQYPNVLISYDMSLLLNVIAQFHLINRPIDPSLTHG